MAQSLAALAAASLDFTSRRPQFVADDPAYSCSLTCTASGVFAAGAEPDGFCTFDLLHATEAHTNRRTRQRERFFISRNCTFNSCNFRAGSSGRLLLTTSQPPNQLHLSAPIRRSIRAQNLVEPHRRIMQDVRMLP